MNSIYVGKVMNVAKNINAAFVELTKGQRAFLPLSHMESARILNRKADGRILAGDELLVQVDREAVKTKEPVLHHGDFPGGAVMRWFFRERRGAAYSFPGKLAEDARLQITEALAAADIREDSLTSRGCSLIVRTNAGELAEEGYAPLIREAQALIRQADELWQTAGMRTCYSCLYRPESGYLTEIRDTPQEEYEEILTDDPALYEQIRAWMEHSCPEALPALAPVPGQRRLPAKPLRPSAKIREACGKRVWLKSGGYLVIEPTEALTVIDVNSGKYTGKKGAARHLPPPDQPEALWRLQDSCVCATFPASSLWISSAWRKKRMRRSFFSFFLRS